MTSDIVVHIAHKLATVKNVSVNVSDTSPRTSSTMENEDANVAENRNATNAQGLRNGAYVRGTNGVAKNPRHPPTRSTFGSHSRTMKRRISERVYLRINIFLD